MRNQFARTLEQVGASDEQLVVLLGDISVFLLRGFQQRFPNRFYNIGISEQTIVGMAAGLSAVGFHPIVHNIARFAVERCYEQIKIDLCYQKLGATIISVGSAFDYAGLGCTHHCYEDFAVLRSLPNMRIVCPSSEIEFDTIFRQTYADNNYPTYFRLPATKHGVKFDPGLIEFGKSIKIKDGNAVTIVVTGPQLRNAIDATEGLDAEIIYVHTIKPLDIPSIRASAQKTGTVVTIEEHSVIGGLGDEVSRAVEDIRNIRQVRIGIRDRFLTEYGSYEQHCAALGLDAKGIKSQVEALI